MKNLLFISLMVLGLGLIFGGCKRNEPSTPDTTKTMADLNVSSDFNWNSTKDVDVYITLPEERPNDIIKIYSVDGIQLFYAGYGDKTSNVVHTTINIASRHTMVKLMYGIDRRYKDVVVSTDGDLSYNYNDFKSAELSDDDCDLDGFKTYSQGGWGSKPNGNNPGSVREEHWDDVFPNGLTAGDPDNYTIFLSSSDAIEDFLPGGGNSKILDQNYTDPEKKDNVAGNWGGQIVAAILNVEYDRKGFMGTNDLTLGELVFDEGTVFEGLTVDEFMEIANTALGGGGLGGYTINEIQNAAEIINLSFDDSEDNDKSYDEYLTCPDNGGSSDCGCEKGLRTLTMTFNGNDDSTVEVKGKNDVIMYSGILDSGENFTFQGTGDDNKMDKTITFYVNGNENTSMHTSCSVDIYIGDVYGDFTVVDGTSKDGLHLCVGSEVPDECGCEDGLRSMSLNYNGSGSANIKVKESKHDKGKGGDKTVFDGQVESGETFSFTGSKEDGKFKKDYIDVYINDNLNTSINVSCEEDLEVGDTYGDFTIIAGNSKDDLPLCGTIGGGGDDPVDPPPGTGGGTTTTNLNGTLAYEDLWPGTGDYDFNDLIINYEFTVTKDDQERVQNIGATFTVYAYGASYHNGFGFAFPNVNPDNVISATGSDIQLTNLFNLSSNGLENGQSKATFIVYDDVYRIMPQIDPAIGVNTELGKTYVTPVTIEMEIVFFDNGSFAPGGAITYDQLDIGNFNPFLVVNKDRAVEIHLPDYPPTDLADDSYFGTYEDDSNIGTGRYYKTVNNLPWCIKIPVVFEYAIEKQDITGAYNHFAEWAESEGVLYPDWYLNTSGYRTSSLIYPIPNK